MQALELLEAMGNDTDHLTRLHKGAADADGCRAMVTSLSQAIRDLEDIGMNAAPLRRALANAEASLH